MRDFILLKYGLLNMEIWKLLLEKYLKIKEVFLN